MRRKSFKILLLLPFLFISTVYSQTEEALCTKETLSKCYEQARGHYLNQDFEAAKIFFEKIIGLDAKYKQAAAYLKKCYKNIAKAAIAEKSQAQSEKSLKQEVSEEYPPAKETHAPGEEVASPEATKVPEIQAYRIGVGDVFDISVWRMPELEKTVIVRPDGRFSYPLVGDVQAAGLTLMEVDQVVTDSLKDFVKAPEVFVAIQKFGGMKVIVLGEVGGQGVVSIPGRANVIDVIAQAGGFKNDAVKKGVFVIRGGIEQPQVYRLNLTRIFKGDFSQNIPIMNNDIVYVPKKFLANINYAITQITPLLSNSLLGITTYKEWKNLLK